MKALNLGNALAFASKQAIEAATSGNTTLRLNGTGCRASALPKVRRGFEGAQGFRRVRILENLRDFFEGAHPFPRCAPKTAHLRRGERCQTEPFDRFILTQSPLA